MKNFILALTLLLCIYSKSSLANNEEKISIYADTCEALEQDESISRARARAADKAVFIAVNKLPVLTLPKKEFDQYDFNILLYKLIDNYVEDLNVRTIRQDIQKICVEVDGYIKGSNIIKSVIETKEIADKRAERRAAENLTGKSPLQTQKEIENIILKEANITPVDTMPATDNGIRVIENQNVEGQIIRYPNEEDISSTETKKVISFEQEENNYTGAISEESTDNITIDDVSSTPNQKVIIQDSDTIIIVNEDEGEAPNTVDFTTKEEIKDNEVEKETAKANVYIAATKFFDNTSSTKHSEILKKLFANNEYFNLTDDKEKADYVVTPNILRVKVDAINNITNRMQMVAMVEMENSKDDYNVREHQNRFTLLSAEDNEQDIAQNLMNKLLEKAGNQILSKIEVAERKKNKIKTLPKILTPGATPLVEDAPLY